jgi:hypothetical protein
MVVLVLTYHRALSPDVETVHLPIGIASDDVIPMPVHSTGYGYFHLQYKYVLDSRFERRGLGTRDVRCHSGHTSLRILFPPLIMHARMFRTCFHYATLVLQQCCLVDRRFVLLVTYPSRPGSRQAQVSPASTY